MEWYEATSDSLPEVTFEMVYEYLVSSPSFSSAEFRGSKTARSARKEYGDKAVGFVRVARDVNICHIEGKITPEHRVKSQPYLVTATIDEEAGEIKTAACHDCASSQGGCKHAVAFLFWLNRRSDEPAPTSIESYWKKSAMSRTGATKFTTLAELAGPSYSSTPTSSSNFRELVLNGTKINNIRSVISSMEHMSLCWSSCSLSCLKKEFDEDEAQKGRRNTAEDFVLFCMDRMSDESCSEAEKMTRSQRKSSLWHELRYGRITASNVFVASRCKTSGGSLVESILGSSQAIDTKAMKRGRELEGQVLAEVQKTLDDKINQCGIFLDRYFPFLGASPDGVTDDLVIEVKCPSSTKTLGTYLTADGEIAEKFLAQIQLQMALSGRKNGLFVVADPQFENNKQFTSKLVNLNEEFLNNLISAAKSFWVAEIFDKL